VGSVEEAEEQGEKAGAHVAKDRHVEVSQEGAVRGGLEVGRPRCEDGGRKLTGPGLRRAICQKELHTGNSSCEELFQVEKCLEV